MSHCINQSVLWQHFEVLQLTENMRVRASGDPVLEAFDQWTLSIGNGIVKNGEIPIPPEMITEIVANKPLEPWHEEILPTNLSGHRRQDQHPRLARW